MMKLSVSCCGLVNELNFEQAAMLANGSIDFFEIGPNTCLNDFNGEVAGRCARILEKNGKRINSFHLHYSSYDTLGLLDEDAWMIAMRRALHWLDVAKAVGASLVVVHPSPPGSGMKDAEAHIHQLRRSLAQLRKATTLDIALENLCGDRVGGSVEGILDILSPRELDGIGVCLDVNHLRSDYRRLPELVRLLGKRLIHIHASDFGGGAEMHWMPGMGVIDWLSFADALRANHYAGMVNYELNLIPGELSRKLPLIACNFHQLFQ